MLHVQKSSLEETKVKEVDSLMMKQNDRVEKGRVINIKTRTRNNRTEGSNKQVALGRIISYRPLASRDSAI